WGGSMPFQRVALATRTELAPSAIETTSWTPTARWMAIRRDKRRLPAYAPSVVAEQRCKAHEASLEKTGLPVEFVDIGPTRDALEVELAAAKHRADALIRCPQGRDLVIYAPSVFRPLMEVPYSNFRGVSLLGWRALEVSPRNPETVALTIELASAMASGRFDRADFYAEELAAVLPDKRARRLALLAAPTAAAAGLPEHALRRMQYGSEPMWNPERDIAYQLARAWAWAAFDRPRRALVEMKAVDELIAKSRANASVQRWRTWTELRAFAVSYTRRSSAEDGFRQGRAFFEDIPGAQSWREAVDWLRWSELGGELPEVSGADERFELFRATAVGKESSCDTCRLDPYGIDAMGWAESLPTGEELRSVLDDIARLPLLAVRPGLTRLVIAQAAGRQLPLAVQMGLASLAPTHSLDATLTAAVEALGASLRCGATDAALPGQESLARLLDLRAAQRQEPRLQTVRWLATTGLELACEDPSKLVARVAEQTERNKRDAALLSSFTTRALASSASRGLYAEDARRMADSAKHGDMPEVCMLWNQAAALAALRAGDIELAESFLLSSVDCHDGEVSPDLDATEAYLGALLHYERTRRVPGQLEGDIERRLAIAMRHRLRDEDTCAGLTELEYWMSAGVSRRVAQLADLLEIEQPADDDGLALRTATRTASNAAASYHAARRALAEARPALAARLLSDAKRDFGTVAHQPGIARTQLLIDVVYADEFEAFLDREPAKTPARPADISAADSDPQTLLQYGHARAILDEQESSAAPPVRLAAALILGRDAGLEALTQEDPEIADGVFCRGTHRQ
ncbi:MAG: hypothetical protein ACQEVA_04650, partial [Myxococcota bacterium]